MHELLTIDHKMNIETIHSRLLNACTGSDQFCFLDGNDYGKDPYSSAELVVALKRSVRSVHRSKPESGSWRFGCLSYDHLKHLTGSVSQRSVNAPGDHDLFFIPEFVFFVKDRTVTIGYYPDESSEQDARSFFENAGSKMQEIHGKTSGVPELVPRISKTEYILAVRSLQGHIQRGDIYEINYCMEFYAENAIIDPLRIYQNLNSVSHSPFSAFCRFGDTYLISSSPERYLKRIGDKLISQPIKGTARRGRSPEEDEKIKNSFRESAKEQRENVMIVDLVRNDLSRIAKPGTVKVDELFGIYSFEQVHQMISTVSCEIESKKTFEEIINATFPMGSMTGAPKIRAMQLIEEYERSARGLYSGAVGYIGPDGNFDLSVVIRSIIYNAKTNYLSFSVGSAITALSDPEQEYEECMLKAKAMFEALK